MTAALLFNSFDIDTDFQIHNIYSNVFSPEWLTGLAVVGRNTHTHTHYKYGQIITLAHVGGGCGRGDGVGDGRCLNTYAHISNHREAIQQINIHVYTRSRIPFGVSMRRGGALMMIARGGAHAHRQRLGMGCERWRRERE